MARCGPWSPPDLTCFRFTGASQEIASHTQVHHTAAACSQRCVPLQNLAVTGGGNAALERDTGLAELLRKRLEYAEDERDIGSVLSVLAKLPGAVRILLKVLTCWTASPVNAFERL